MISNSGSWGYFQQGNEQLQDVEQLGAELSRRLECTVHWPAFGKNLFECRCGIIFPVYVVKGARDSGDWSAVLTIHSGGRTGNLVPPPQPEESSQTS